MLFSLRSLIRRQSPKPVASNPGYNANVERIRDEEYPQLKGVFNLPSLPSFFELTCVVWSGQVYLDHSGTTLYAESLLTSISADFRKNLYGNPHSANPSSKLSSGKVDAIRVKVLQLFKADPAKFDVVFCANTTAGVKLVSDSFAGHPKEFEYRFHKDCHTSLIGPRGLAESSQCFDSDDKVREWLADTIGESGDEKLGLFAWPGQSNFSGRRLPVHEWASQLRKSHPNYYSMLDAAALVMTSPLDLSDEESSPDFIVCSFYKMFGYPDLGALIVRRSSAEVLQHRRFFGGGTVSQLMSSMPHTMKRFDSDPHEHLEDGTCAFHSIIALGHAIDTHERLFGSFSRISLHTSSLASLLAGLLSNLTHPLTGRKAVEIYTEETHSDPKAQGPVITINLSTATGECIGYLAVEAAAAARNIHIRSGGHCNPGGVQQYCGLSPAEMKANFDAGKVCGDDQDVINGKPTGAVRVSLGAMSTLDDVLRFVAFIKEEYVDKHSVSFAERRKMLLGERKKEVAEAKKLMKKYGTVVSTGSGGSGKTLLCFWADSVNLGEKTMHVGVRKASPGASPTASVASVNLPAIAA